MTKHLRTFGLIAVLLALATLATMPTSWIEPHRIFNWQFMKRIGFE